MGQGQGHESHEGHEGHEEEEGEHHREGQDGQVIGASWQQDKDRGWSDSEQSHEEQEWQGCFEGRKLEKWGKACVQARKQLNLKGFVPLGGKTAAGKALYAKAKAIYTA